MSSYPRPWALCGGWAIDAWLGRLTREHGDVDLSVFDADHKELFGHLDGWQLIPHSSVIDDGSTGLWDGGRLPVPSHIHARAPQDAGPLPEDGVCEPAKGWWLDIQIDAAEGDAWVVRREPLITARLADAIRPTPWGAPAVTPEVLLFFKAGLPRRRDWQDFVAFLPHLDGAQIAWLHDAIGRAYPEHPWIDALAWRATTRA
jgi:hypothetical protein